MKFTESFIIFGGYLSCKGVVTTPQNKYINNQRKINKLQVTNVGYTELDKI